LVRSTAFPAPRAAAGVEIARQRACQSASLFFERGSGNTLTVVCADSART
jgi:hypothetical protein